MSFTEYNNVYRLKDNIGKIEYSFYEGTSDQIILNFYKNTYLDINHFDKKGILLNRINEIILENNFDSVLFINKVEINKDYRGQGYCKQLISEIIEETIPKLVILLSSPFEDCPMDIQELALFYEKIGFLKDIELIHESGYLMYSII